MTTNRRRPKPVNFDVCTTGRVDKRKGRPLTLARLRRAANKLKRLESARALRCGCVSFRRADGGIILVTADRCQEHTDNFEERYNQF